MRLREIRRARLALTSTGVAPGNAETLLELRDEARRPRQLAAPLPEEALHHVPETTLRLELGELAKALRAGGRGSAPDLAGMRYEHLRVV